MGTRYNCLGEVVLTSTHNLCLEQKYEKISDFLPGNCQFLMVKFSLYFNRRVFVMNNKLKELLQASIACLNCALPEKKKKKKNSVEVDVVPALGKVICV